MRSRRMGVFFKLLTLLLVAVYWAEPDDIYQENGGFKGILVAINENVPYDPRILENLKELMIRESEALYKATEYDINNSGDPDQGLTSGKHLAQVTVLVPKSWPRQSQCDEAKSETYGNADFRVIQPSAQYGDYLMHTEMQNSDCGEPGIYTEIPVTFLLDLDASKIFYGEDLGKAMVHEWGQLRWGLREESNNKDGGDTCYVDEDWNNQRYRIAIRCSYSVKGATIPDPKDKDKCIFKPGNDNSNKATASLMHFYLPFYSKMYTFCDSRYDLPNGEPNLVPEEVLHDGDIDHPHNHVCDRQSPWQVLRDHLDFDRANAAPEVTDFEANLDLRCVQQKPTERIVMVMDVSGSMDGARIQQLQSDVALFLQSLPYGDTEIGMVEFNTVATLLVPIIPLDSDANLQRLLNAIPTVAFGGTCIGNGLTKAIELLEVGLGKTAAGGLITLFTDGEETHAPYIADVADYVLQKGSVVHGLLMIAVADGHDLIMLAVDSGGTACIYEDSGNGGIDYYQCMNEIIDGIGSFAAAEIKTEDVQVPVSGSVDGSVQMDSSFKANLRYTLSWTATTIILTQSQAQALELSGNADSEKQPMKATNCIGVTLVITAPEGSVIDQTSPRYDYQAQFRLITVNASGFPEGEWKYKVQSGSSACNARLRIEGFPDTSSPDDEKQPILMTARADKVNVNVQSGGNPKDNIVMLHSTLRQGLSSVVDAEVIVTVDAGGSSQQITLLDNGQGADNAADDGIYSAYFYQYSGDGAYSVRAAAKGISGQTQILRETRELQNTTLQDGYKVVRTQNRVSVAAFERAAIGGAFEVATNGVTDMNAIIPPARINDLKRSAMTNDSVEITWTAVGGSMLDGKADHYEVRICANVTDEWDTSMEVDQSMLTEGDLSTPKRSGLPELIAISLDYLEAPINGSSYYVRVKAVDQYGNKGASSNLAQIKGVVPPAPPPPTLPPATLPPMTPTPAPGTPGPVPPPATGNIIGILAACVVFLTVVGAVAGVLIYKKNRDPVVHPDNTENVESVQFEDRQMEY